MLVEILRDVVARVAAALITLVLLIVKPYFGVISALPTTIARFFAVGVEV